MYTERLRPATRPHLDQNSPAQLGFDQRLGHPAGGVGRRTVHFGEVFAGECSTAVSPPTSVRVHDDLPARHTSITLWVEQSGNYI